MLRALVNALAAQTALFKVNVGQIVFKRDGLKRTGLYALAATYAGHGARFPGYRPLILVNATHIDPAVHLVLVAEFNDKARAGLYAGTACSTFILINNRQTGVRVHADGIKLADLDTVTTPQTAVKTACGATVHQVCEGSAFWFTISDREMDDSWSADGSSAIPLILANTFSVSFGNER